MPVTKKHHIVLHGATLLVWLVLAASATYWPLQIDSSSHDGTLFETVQKIEATDTANLTRMLGNKSTPLAVPTVESSRFALRGVISGAAGKEAALIAVNDNPARTYMVGDTLVPGYFLHSTAGREVKLSATRGGLSVLTLQMSAVEK